MRILVTAGPTREYIDDVRFISNPSSGRMGYAVAAEAAARGHEVTLLTGPVCLDAPAGVEVARFESVEDLYSQAESRLTDADCLVMAAAVGDYRPARRLPGKHKKTATFTLELVATRDVLAALAKAKGRRIFVGFAVETDDAVERARSKLERKSMDMLVLNDPSSFAADQAQFTLVFPDGERSLGRIAKARLAAIIMDEVEALFQKRQGA